MTPLELIRQGILQGSLQLVEDGYTALTGEVVTKKVVTEAKPISKEPVPHVFDNGLDDEGRPIITEEIVEDPDDSFRVQIRDEHKQHTRELDDGTVQTEARVEKVDLSKIGAFNMFSDDGEEDVDNRDGDKGLYVKKLEPRRTEIKKVTATCVDCQKIFKVLPIHQLEGSFTCTKCINRKRRR